MGGSEVGIGTDFSGKVEFSSSYLNVTRIKNKTKIVNDNKKCSLTLFAPVEPFIL